MQDAPILQKVADVYRALYLATGKMPKRDKYTLGERSHHANLSLLEYLTAASYLGREKKFAALHQAAIKLDVLRMFLRLAEQVRAVPTRTYLDLEEQLDAIGKMLGGWMRSLK